MGIINEMNITNLNGIAKLNTIGLDVSGEVPIKGWIVRERFNEANKPVSLEFGMYITADSFIGIPIHFSLKGNFMKCAKGPGVQYYNIPDSIMLGVDKFTYKSGNSTPMLVKIDKEEDVRFITALGYSSEQKGANVINLELDNKTKVLRKSIDKARNYVVVILASEWPITDAVSKVSIREGYVNTIGIPDKQVIFTFSPLGTNSEVFTLDLSEKAKKTEFIALNNYYEIEMKPKADNHQAPANKHNTPREKMPREFNKDNKSTSRFDNTEKAQDQTQSKPAASETVYVNHRNSNNRYETKRKFDNRNKD